MTDAEVLMAVDGTGLFVRCAKAAQHSGMTAPDGTPTGAGVMFTNSLAAMTREVRPTHLMIAWDSGLPGTTWRRRICPDYKAKRQSWGRDIREFEVVRLICDAAGITQWAIDDFEADDLLAAFFRLSRAGFPDCENVILCSDDRDVLQLIEPGRVCVRSLGRDGEFVLAQNVLDAWGVYPEQLPRLRALAGDRSDGIPGLPGVGPARALSMLRRAGYNWPLPEEVLPDPAQWRQARAWHDVMTLHGAPEMPEHHDDAGILDIRETAWTRGNILPVLEQYGMNSLAERWRKGTLW